MADETEKVSINVSAMDLANIDLLVEKTVYKDRTDFFRTAARNQIDKHSYIIQATMDDYNEQKKSEKKLVVWIGQNNLNRKEMEVLFSFRGLVKQIDETQLPEIKFKIVAFGSLRIENDLTLEFLREHVVSIKVFGIFKAPPEIKQYYS